MPKTNNATHWYQEPWAWFIVLIIAITAIWGSFLLHTAITQQDSVVVDDYYKTGKAINASKTRSLNAKNYAMRAVVVIQPTSSTIRLQLNGALAQRHETLSLQLLSPITAKDDHRILLNRIEQAAAPDQPSLYEGYIETVPRGVFHLQLESITTRAPEEDYTSGWRLNLETQLPQNQPIVMSP